MEKRVVRVTPAPVPLKSTRIPAKWVLSGAPQARSRNPARSHDWTSHLVTWDCAAGRFKWHYSQDETLLVVSGEAVMTNECGEERHFGPGDIGFFPAGTSCTWWVPEHIRKVAGLNETMWRPLGFVLKTWNQFWRTIRGRGAAKGTAAGR